MDHDPTPEKRINTARKGRDIELRAKKWLEANGYKVDRTVRTGRRRRGQPGWISNASDTFGTIDLVGKKFGERTRWIQVTCDTAVGAKIDKLRTIPWTMAHDNVELWRWVGGRDQYFQVYALDTDFKFSESARILLGGNQ